MWEKFFEEAHFIHCTFDANDVQQYFVFVMTVCDFSGEKFEWGWWRDEHVAIGFCFCLKCFQRQIKFDGEGRVKMDIFKSDRKELF